MPLNPSNIDSSHLRMIVDATSDLVIISDLQRNIIYANRSTCDKTGYSKKELLNTKVNLLYPPGKQQQYSAKISSALHRRGKWHGQSETLRKDGSTFWTDSIIEWLRDRDGKPTGMIGIGRDLSTTRLLSKQAWESETSLASIMKSMIDGLFVCDTNGNILMCNDSFETMVGHDEEEIIGSRFPYLWLDKQGNKKLEEYFRILRKDGQLRNCPLALKHSNGKVIKSSLMLSFFSNKKKKEDRFIVTLRDVSDVHYVDELWRAKEQIERLVLDSKRKAMQLQILQEANNLVLNNSDIAAVFRAVTDGVKKIVEHDLAGIYVYHQGKNAFIPHTLSKQTKFSRELGKHPLPLGEGIISAAAMSGEMVWVNNAQLDPRSRYPKGVRPEKEHFIAVPLMDSKAVFGILVVARNRDPQFIEEEINIVELFAKAVSVALENVCLHNELKILQEGIEQTGNEVSPHQRNGKVAAGRRLVNFDGLKKGPTQVRT